MDEAGNKSAGAPSASSSAVAAAASASDSRVPLLRLSAVGRRMDSLRRFLHDAVDGRAGISIQQLQIVSSDIALAVHEIILSGAALLASAHSLPPSSAPAAPGLAVPPPSETRPSGRSTGTAIPRDPREDPDLLVSDPVELEGEDCDIVEIDSADLLAEHVHTCEICGKGFRRDANLRMHMRAHGNRFKTLEALSKPDRDAQKPYLAAAEVADAGKKRRVRFSCPFAGCNRNQAHKKFRPLKSVVCVRNHFKRSHCPKMYRCQRCGKKNFSVLSDLKSHLKHCGETLWRCSCGTSFSRRDKLFAHIALFEGHMPAIETGKQGGEKKKKKGPVSEGGEGSGVAENNGDLDPEFFKALMEDLNEIDRGDWMVQ